MDALVLSRIQFGIAVGVHYLYAMSSLGLTLYILLFETLFLLRKDDRYRTASTFLLRLLAVVFTVGVATGFVLPFSFGANWARFSSFAAPVLGLPLALETITAFALESIFLSILLFGRGKVGPRIYWLSALLVFIGAHLSAFWIVAANSWMNTPAGYVMKDGQILLTSLTAAVFNPSTLLRVTHVILGAWLAGTVLVAGIGAYYVSRKRFVIPGGLLLKTTVVPLLVMACVQIGVGHFHILEVIEHEPAKDAAYEGIFSTARGAPFYPFGIPDPGNERIRFTIPIPYMLSFLETGHFDSPVTGLNEFPPEMRPPVTVLFTTFHLMVMVGVVLVALGGAGTLLLWRRKLLAVRWFPAILPFCIPLPYIANELGWIGTEMGRQPWIIYGLLTTKDSVSSNVAGWQMVASLMLISLIYAGLSALCILFFVRIVRRGPVEQAEATDG